MNVTMIKPLRKLVLMSLAVGVITLTGCATTGDLDGLRSQVEAASADASAARTDAAAARTEAAAAKAMAAEALQAANEAKAQSADTDTRIDRMFKKAMHK